MAMRPMAQAGGVEAHGFGFGEDLFGVFEVVGVVGCRVGSLCALPVPE